MGNMILGISGFAGSGKDTAADYLIENHGFKKISFAAPLKALAFNVNPVIRTAPTFTSTGDDDLLHKWGVTEPLAELVEEMGWDEAKRRFNDIRVFLQGLGHGARITFNDDFWIDQALGPKNDPIRINRIVVSDVRYPNEAERVKLLGGHILRIERPGVGPVNDHATEQVLPHDYLVENPNDKLEEMYHRLDTLVGQIESVNYLRKQKDVDKVRLFPSEG